MKSIHDEKLVYIPEHDIYRAVQCTDAYNDDCFGCVYSRSSPLMSPSAKCVLRPTVTCGWGYVCDKFNGRENNHHDK